MSEKIKGQHTDRKAILYVRQSTAHQVQFNEESKRLQYAMKQRLLSLGWKEVDIIDEDLGHSAATTGARLGFNRMVAEVCLGKVGAVAAREVSRFARNSRDWHQLVEMCSLVGALLVDHESIYDPRSGNDRLLLGLKGSLNEYELELLRHRSLQARWAKASRGELGFNPAVGFVRSDSGFEKDPDQQVQQAIQLVFDKFFEMGSARQVLMWLIEHDLRVPAARHGNTGWERHWRSPGYRSVVQILKDPIYAGAYAYGKTEAVSHVEDGILVKTRIEKPIDEWKVLIRDHHDGYISWNQYERIQTMLTKNKSNFGLPVSGAAKKGSALMAGIVRCRRCGRKLMVSYSGKNRVLRYSCRRIQQNSGCPPCISFGGLNADEALTNEILRIVQPGAVDAAILAASQITEKNGQVLRSLRLELQSSRYEADRAWKQFDGVDPEHRLVADELERRWNQTLSRVREIQNRVDTEEQTRPELDEQAVADSLAHIANNLSDVWNDPKTDIRLKKRIVRTLVEEILVDIDDEHGLVELIIHWKGGAHSELTVKCRRRGENGQAAPSSVRHAVEILVLVCADPLIAKYLNRNRLLTGSGNRWTQQLVASFRWRYKIPAHNEKRQRQQGWMMQNEASRYAGVSPRTLQLAFTKGSLKALQPLPDGPRIYNRADLDSEATSALFAHLPRARRRHGKPEPRQTSLVGRTRLRRQLGVAASS